MNDMTDPLAADAIDMARSTLPVFVVAESPSGPVYSHDNGFPEDTTMVWVGSGEPEPMGDLYARFGDDLIAYAEPEEATVTAAVDDNLDESDMANPTTDTANPDEATAQDPAADPVGAGGGPADDPADQVAVRAALINQAGHDALDQIEAFLDQAEHAVAVTAGLTDRPDGTPAVSVTTMRMAVGGNPTAQQQIRDAFEAHYDPDVNRFMFAVLGERPADNASHDGEAWDAIDREARLWHAKKVAVAAALRTR